MDLAAVKDASARDLALASAAAARNAQSLADDAELLCRAGRLARATGLAGLAIEEVGKAGGLAIVAAMPESLRAQAPVARMLVWHQMKLVKGELIAAVPYGVSNVVDTLATRPLSEIADLLDDAQVFASDVDRLKQRGLYVDMDKSGNIREPSAVTAAQVCEQLDRARQAAAAVDALLDPEMLASLAAAGPDRVEFARALVSACAESGHGRTPEAAAEVLLSTAGKLQG